MIVSTLLEMLIDNNFKKFYVVDIENLPRDDLLGQVYSEGNLGIKLLQAIKERLKNHAEIISLSDISSYLNYVDGTTDVTTVASDTNDHILLQEMNSKLAPNAAAPIIYTWFDGAELFIDPVHTDGESACFEDFIRSNLINSVKYYDSKKVSREAESYQCARPAIMIMGLNFAVGVLGELAINLVLNINPVDHLINKILVVNPITPSIMDIPIWHELLCEVCARHYKEYI